MSGEITPSTRLRAVCNILSGQPLPVHQEQADRMVAQALALVRQAEAALTANAPPEPIPTPRVQPGWSDTNEHERR